MRRKDMALDLITPAFLFGLLAGKVVGSAVTALAFVFAKDRQNASE